MVRKYDKSRHRFGGVVAVYVTYHDDSDACMLQCLLLVFFFYSFSIISKHEVVDFVLACHCKNVLSVKSNSSPIPGKSVFLTPWPRVSNFIMFAIMILFTAAKV